MVWLLVMCDGCLILTSRKKNYLFFVSKAGFDDLLEQRKMSVVVSAEGRWERGVGFVGRSNGRGVFYGALKKNSPKQERASGKKRLNLHT